jgi:hypothetical protein
VVNTTTLNVQTAPAVASDPAGNFVVAWHDGVTPGNGADGGGYGVFGQRFGTGGARLGFEFRVNTYTTGNQFGPAVASDASGNFVVAWTSNDQDGSSQGIFGQRFAANGLPSGGEFRVNTYTTSLQRRPAVASDAGGNFVVTWEGRGPQDLSSYGVFGQRYDASGTAIGADFRVSSFTTSYQSGTTVAYAPTGDFVVAWHSFGIANDYEVRAQRFDASGAPLGEFMVNTYTTGPQSQASIAADAAGFTVVWDSNFVLGGQDGDNFGVFGQRFAPLPDLIFEDGFE